MKIAWGGVEPDTSKDRVLRKPEIKQRACDICCYIKHGSRRNTEAGTLEKGQRVLICPFEECPFHELDNTTYEDYIKDRYGE